MKLKNIRNTVVLLFLLQLGLQTARSQEVWTLEQCVDTALVNNKKLKIDKNNILISEAKQKEVKSNLYPKLNATFDYKYFFDLPTQLMPASAFNPMAPEWQFNAAQFGVPHNINANVQLGMPLYNAQIYGGIKATKIASELKTLQFKKTKEGVYVTISNLYYNAQIIKNQIAFMDTNIKNSNKLLDNLKLLKEQQLATGTDVNKVDLQVKQLQTQKNLLVSKYQQIINALKINMGFDAGTMEVVSKIDYQKLPVYSKQKITDIQMAETKKKLNESEIKTLKRGRLPSVTLYGSYGQTGYGYDEKPNDFLDFYSVSFVGLKVAVPVFDISRRHKINQKKIESENTDLQLSLLGEQNDMEIESAKNQLAITQLTINNTLEQIDLAQSVYDNTVLQHKQDTASITDVLLADNNLRQAQQNYIAAVIDYLKADLELKKLTGNIIN
jgi:OMF family outer membrane factor